MIYELFTEGRALLTGLLMPLLCLTIFAPLIVSATSTALYVHLAKRYWML